MKFLVKTRNIQYGYIVVEAETAHQAMKHLQYGDEFTVTSSGHYETLKAIPIEKETDVFLSGTELVVTSPDNKQHTVRKLQKKLNYKPFFDKIDFTKMRCLHLPNGYKKWW